MNPESRNAENREMTKERLIQNWGISFSSKHKDGNTVTVEDEIRLAQDLDLHNVQIDLKDKDVSALRRKLLEFVRANDENLSVSLHSEIPQIDEETLGVKNAEKIEEEIDLAVTLGAKVFTIHPPNISKKLFDSISGNQRESIIENYCVFLSKAVMSVLKSGKSLTIAVENLPAKGEGGNFGQTPEEIKILIDRIKDILTVRMGIEPSEVDKFVGITLDVNHALSGKTETQEELTSWIKILFGSVKAFHVYAPGEVDQKFNERFDLVMSLCREYGIDVPIYLESKQDLRTTKKVFLEGLSQLEKSK